MKKAVVICLLACVAASGFAQQIPLYSLNFDNRFVYNPARAGFNGNPELYLMYRKQWTEFNGAPETRAASFDMNVKKGGFGLYLFNDITDVFRTWGGSFSYAYHLRFKNDMHRLSIGLSAGIQDYSFDREKAFVQNTDDPLLQGDHGVSFDGSAGLNYAVTKGPLLNLSLGLSAIHIYATDLKFLNDAAPSTLFIPDRHYLATLSNRFKFVDEKIILEPLVMARFTEAMNYQIEPGLLVGYKDWVWVSGLYRYDYGVTIAGGFKVHNTVKIGYAYDLALNEIKDHTNGTHELMLGIIFGKKDDQATKAEVEELRQKLMEQDTLMNEIQEEQDSLMNTIDSLNQQMDKMQYEIDSLEGAIESMEISIDDSTLAKLLKSSDLLNSGDKSGMTGMNKEVEKMREELEQLKKEKEDIEASVKSTKTKVKDMESEMTEERTRIVNAEDLVVKKGPPLGDYFMVVGSFRVEQNSDNYYEDLKKRGYDAGVVFDKKRLWYYVFIAQPKDLKKGLQDVYKLREENAEFYDAWIHIMSKTMR